MSKLCKDCACENVCSITHLPEDKACGFYYKAETVTELEKIKTEIDDLDRHFDNDYFSGNKESMFKCNEVFEILDKRIAELKGENK